MRKKIEETTEKIVKSIPASDNGAGVLCVTNSGQKYQISQNVERKKFTLWQVVNKGFIKIKTANSPVDLYDLVPWEK
ncbi:MULTISPECIES: hypothetical protein [Bacteria]|jgi:hypothetical protein|uniref:hypothetical protein n=1 Tax=Bacteria TaxID=2 RepID=UPI001C3EF252|nr:MULTISPECIES: hypothetical protein [Bacteria]